MMVTQGAILQKLDFAKNALIYFVSFRFTFTPHNVPSKAGLS